MESSGKRLEFLLCMVLLITLKLCYYGTSFDHCLLRCPAHSIILTLMETINEGSFAYPTLACHLVYTTMPTFCFRVPIN